MKLSELAERLKNNFSGDGDFEIHCVCGLDDPRAGGIAFANKPAQLKNLTVTVPFAPFAIVVPKDCVLDGWPLLHVEDPQVSHVLITHMLHQPKFNAAGVHPSAIISPLARLGLDVHIGAGVVLYDGVVIGDGCILHAGVVLMHDVKVGEDTLIYPNVTIREDCEIGKRVILQPGCVIGSDGFGFFQRQGKNLKIPQIGRVIIEDDVEIGACCTIDRARFSLTIIKQGTKLDNMVHIAHNVEIGEHSLISAQSGIAGSVKTGDHLLMGGQSGIVDHITVGSRVTAFARTLIVRDTPDQTQVSGFPSRPAMRWRRIEVLLDKLEDLFDRVRNLEKKSPLNEC